MVWPLLVYGGIAFLLPVIIICLSWALGERHREPATDEPYESGIPVTGSGSMRFSAHFYLVSVLFVIFDLEAVFLYAWAVAVPELGWPGLVQVAIFCGVLLLALVYLARNGALNWTRSARRE